MKIPFNKPALFNSSYKEITNSLESGNHSGRGPYTKQCENWFKANNPNISGAFLSTSCTHALEASAILLDLKEGDEVIVPSYTFVTTALSFFMHGATIRFCDIRPDTLNINEKLLESLISKKTRAIVVVHYAGIACEMDEIMALAKKYDLFVIEDNAHGLLGKYKGINLGSIGNFATHSFHETKNITCGEGGALFVRDKDFIERSEIIFEKGTNRSKFINGQVDKYSWVDKGSSYILSDLLASLLYAQLDNFTEIQNKRKTLWNNYYESLNEWSIKKNIQLPYVPHYCEQTYHMFYMILPNNKKRNDLIEHLKHNDIKATFHYLPLDSSKMGVKIKHNDQHECPVSKRASDCIIRLPLYFDLSDKEQEKVIQSVISFEL
jgi:dTDP-4-amino-4,6-dideoxygalactose transaminase